MTPPSPRSHRGSGLPARGGLTFLTAVVALGLLGVSGTAKGPYVVMPPLIVDPNTAPPAVLNALPKLGPAMIRRIVAAREEAPFRSLDDLDARRPRDRPGDDRGTPAPSPNRADRDAGGKERPLNRS